MEVTILDIRTGKLYKQNNKMPIESYIDGNWSCDCNRRPAEIDEPEYDIDDGICDGYRRFIVVDIDKLPKGYEFGELNMYYPQHLTNLSILWYNREATESVLAQYNLAGYYLTENIPEEE